MRHKYSQCGQVVVEAAISLALLIVVLLGWQQLWPLTEQQHQQLTTNRQALWARDSIEHPITVSKNYSGARYSANVLQVITSMTELELPYKTYRRIHGSDRNQYPMGRVTDGWSATSKERLASQPRSLVATSLLAADTAKDIQDVLGGLPFAEELASDQLIFGHIDTDVVPKKALREY